MRKRIYIIDFLFILTINIVLFIGDIWIGNTIVNTSGRDSGLISFLLLFITPIQFIVCLIWEFLLTLFASKDIIRKKLRAFIISNSLLPILLLFVIGNELVIPFALLIILVLLAFLYNQVLNKQVRNKIADDTFEKEVNIMEYREWSESGDRCPACGFCLRGTELECPDCGLHLK